jgi:hypothetical protein
MPSRSCKRSHAEGLHRAHWAATDLVALQGHYHRYTSSARDNELEGMVGGAAEGRPKTAQRTAAHLDSRREARG